LTRKAAINTDYGTITIEIYEDKMPISCKRFVELVERGEFNKGNMPWHRVEDWVIQTGESIKGYPPIKLEIEKSLKHNAGAVGMARTNDPNSATAQFYIVKKDAHSLDGRYAMFGMVTDGAKVMDKIKPNDRIISIKML
jgi:peptidyl-prolyl cis-trans isomerase B (cyclophilin B)